MSKRDCRGQPNSDFNTKQVEMGDRKRIMPSPIIFLQASEKCPKNSNYCMGQIQKAVSCTVSYAGRGGKKTAVIQDKQNGKRKEIHSPGCIQPLSGHPVCHKCDSFGINIKNVHLQTEDSVLSAPPSGCSRDEIEPDHTQVIDSILVCISSPIVYL